MYAQQCCNVKGSSLICLAICWSHPQCILLSAVMNAGILSWIGDRKVWANRLVETVRVHSQARSGTAYSKWCACVCVCVCVCACAYLCACVCVCLYACPRGCVCICVCYVCPRGCMCVYVYLCTRARLCVSLCVCVCVPPVARHRKSTTGDCQRYSVNCKKQASPCVKWYFIPC